MDEEARAAESQRTIDELREQLGDAEKKRDHLDKENYVLKSRLDESVAEHARIEDASNEQIEKIEALTKDAQDSARRYKELENIYENEKSVSLKEREESHNREEELNEIIQRLKDSLSGREQRKGSDSGEGMLSRTASFRGRASPGIEASSPALQARDSSSNNAKLVLQKDKVIESLRLELAESQIRLVEMENKGGGHLQELERSLLEARMSNAKLMEDNESYQVLLSEKTLNGDMAKSSLLEPPKSPGARSVSMQHHHGSNLADELSGVQDDHYDHHDADYERMRRLEADVEFHKDQNKALTLYINKIIGRLLATEQFEHLFQDGVTGKDEDPLKEPILPPPPPKDIASAAVPGATDASAAPSLLQRAGSLFGGRKNSRPQNLINRINSANPDSRPDTSTTTRSNPSPPPSTPSNSESLTLPNPDSIKVQKRLSANEDPNLAPSLPLRRSASARKSHRRSNSDWSASVVNQMYRGPPSSGSGPGPLSPSAVSNRASFFAPGQAPPLILEDHDEKPSSDDGIIHRSDVASDSGYADSVTGSDRPGSPRSDARAALEGRAPGDRDSRWWQQQKGAAEPPAKGGMRPLRLVQEKREAEEAALAEARKANRASFMSGWFSKGEEAGPAAQGSPERAR